MNDLFEISSLMRTAGLSRCAEKVEDLAKIRENLIKKRLVRTLVKGKGYPEYKAYDIVYDPDSIEKLNLCETNVSDLSPLSGLTNLGVLCLNGTKVSDLKPLESLTNLRKLLLYRTNVTDLSPLSGLTNLKTLDLEGTKVKDLSPLKGLTNLKILDLINTKVKDLSPIQHLRTKGLKVFRD